MATPPVSHEQIAEQARLLAGRLKAVAARAKKEEEIRVEMERFLESFRAATGLKLEGKHEFTVASGRVDSVYDCAIIEYKNPASHDRLSEKSDAAGNKKVVEQVRKRFYDLRNAGRKMNTLFGVACDGNYFIFVRFRGDKWTDEPPVPVTPATAERFLNALVNLNIQGQSAFTPEELAKDFGAKSPVAQRGVKTFYDAICSTKHPKAETFFQQWKVLFSEVCGYDLKNPTPHMNELASIYDIPGKIKHAELLFALHTYYALLMKLLAAEIVAYIHGFSTPLERLAHAPTSEKLQEEVRKLEEGDIFREMNVSNFLEGDLFTWYTAAWNADIEKTVSGMAATLERYNPNTLSENPAESRDLLKKLYHELLPKAVRHDLGEYYTPDWLAEHVLDELGYDGNPDKRILDPSCGSGTFLAMAISRIRQWYEENKERCPFDEKGLVERILNNVIGFDLNPIAVMAARTNYLIAIRGLTKRLPLHTEIPVYLCDSIVIPRLGEKMQEKNARLVSTIAAEFPIHTSLAENRSLLGRYTEILEDCVKGEYTPAQFMERVQTEGIPTPDEDIHKQLYKEVLRLNKEGRNRVWARIIKNAFAPLFVGKVDYVAGNPPWVNWESLPPVYRDSVKPLWQRYGLFSLSGAEGRLGGGKKDLSMIFTYACVDHYLKSGGKLGFVITQTVFKTKGAGDGFRRFRFQHATNGKAGQVFLNVKSVHDMSDFQPFEGATNKTATFSLERSDVPMASEGSEARLPVKYPVPYTAWRKIRGKSIAPEMSLSQVRKTVKRLNMGAVPVDKYKITSPWLTASKKIIGNGIHKAIGKSDYEARAGACTWLNGVFWVRIREKLPNGNLLIENLHDVGKIRVPAVGPIQIEPDLVYPLIRGRDVKKWNMQSNAYMLLTQDPRTREGIPERVMKSQKYHKTFRYLQSFEKLLRARSGFRRYYSKNDPFYSIYNVGPYTLSPWKCVWNDMGRGIKVSAVSSVTDNYLGRKMVLTGPHTMFVEASGQKEALYCVALLNSAISQAIIIAYSVSTGITTHVMKHVAIPRFDPKNKLHRRLAELSEKAHALAAKSEDVSRVETEINKAAAKLWGLTDGELKNVQDSLKDMEKPKRKAKGGGASRIAEESEEYGFEAEEE